MMSNQEHGNLVIKLSSKQVTRFLLIADCLKFNRLIRLARAVVSAIP